MHSKTVQFPKNGNTMKGKWCMYQTGERKKKRQAVEEKKWMAHPNELFLKWLK